MKNQKTGEWRPPKEIARETEKRKKDDVPPPEKNPGKKEEEYPEVILSWQEKGKQRHTSWVVSDLEVHEQSDSRFEGANKKIWTHLTLDATVVKKL